MQSKAVGNKINTLMSQKAVCNKTNTLTSQKTVSTKNSIPTDENHYFTEKMREMSHKMFHREHHTQQGQKA
ncbi:hypothetical protein RDI58_007135 [Solanum bulbocastanum]|uniref:Uncharacterized protein n=1 Tax=Solanum bulbocastanum TaxID=147425 RepID=A0AAN8TYN4_SOLBU